MEKFKDFATKTTGFIPYDYQVAVAEKILSGKNIILSVPTGAGKTWASILPFLFAQEENIHFPKKMIYSLPLRTLANSIYEDVTIVLKKMGLPEEEITRQTGEYSDDKYFEKDIIFSTIDQTLSNFLCFPLPLSSRQANINAGSLIGSYLIFDEFHLLDENLSMATTLGTLQMLKNLCRCCIMTATLSDDFMALLKENLPNYEIINLDDFESDKLKIGSLLPIENKKKIHVVGETISAQSIIAKHQNKTIVICNRVETAQKIYTDLIDKKLAAGLTNTEVICLHSRFFDDDRKTKENRLKGLFGKNTPNTNAILISTQVIEAGMDISCEMMHTEISPINSLLQRAGRCARFENERGQIFIYDVLEISEKELIQIEVETKEDKTELRRINNKYLPYEKNICVKTLDELKKYNTLDGNIPKNLIESILGETEKDIITKMKTGQNGGFNKDKIVESWNACQKNHYRSTIRDIQSVEITLITDRQCKEVAKYPFRYQSLGMFKWSLVSWLNKIAKNEGPVNYDCEDWLVKRLEPNNIIGEIEDEEEIEFQLTKIEEYKELPNQVFVNSKYFGYHKEFGFNWQFENTFNSSSPKSKFKEKDDQFKPLEKDTFFQHNMGLIGAFEQEFLSKKIAKDDKLDFAFAELAKYIEAPELLKDDFIKLIKLMIVLHDYGKLNMAWQKPMQTYQALKEGIEPNKFKEILGHTDFDSKNENDKALGSKAELHKRPPHAGIGAFVALTILGEKYKSKDLFLKILSPLATSIMRHHSPLSSRVVSYDISNENFQEFLNLHQKIIGDLKYQDLKRLLKFNPPDILKYLTIADNTTSMFMYFFLIRILRICDQKATEDLKKYYTF